MKIQPYRHYVVHCKQANQTYCIWNLIVLPGYKSWRIIGEDIQVNTYFYDHLILSIEDITDTERSKVKVVTNDCEPEINPWEAPISLDDYHEAVRTAGFYLNPCYGSTYRCQICNGVVINDICSECMFDWNS